MYIKINWIFKLKDCNSMGQICYSIKSQKQSFFFIVSVLILPEINHKTVVQKLYKKESLF